MNQQSRGSLAGCFRRRSLRRGQLGATSNSRVTRGAAGRLGFSLTMGWRQTFLPRGLSAGQLTAWQLASPE